MANKQIEEALVELRQLLREQWRRKDGRPATQKFRAMLKRFLPRIIGRQAHDDHVSFVEYELDDCPS